MFNNLKKINNFGFEMDTESSDGSCYIGEFNNNVREGYGEQFWPGGTRSGDKRSHSCDKMLTRGSQSYSGGWLHDKCHGFGAMNYENFDVYEGEWFEHQRHGHGVMHYHRGEMQIFDGQWRNGFRVFKK
jgi:hypothetical protein